MQTVFLNYLVEEGWLTSDQVAARRRPVASPQSWIGQLMLNHGLIGVEEINEILRRQDLHRGLFGENAMALGYVTQSQVDALLASQELRRTTELIEDLALSGCLDFHDGLTALCRFYLSRCEERSRSGPQTLQTSWRPVERPSQRKKKSHSPNC